MDKTLFGVPNLDVILVLGILVFFGLIETLSGYLHRTKRTGSDWIQELGGFFALSTLIKPGIVGSALFLGSLLAPEKLYVLSGINFWYLLPLYLLVDDILQYWYHRSAHEYEWLWKLHRPHHQAEEMGFFVSYRNAALYYILMPNIWWVGIFTFLGGAKAVALGLILKQLVIIGSHSTVKWDAPLYKSKLFSPIMYLVERIIITPAFHYGHHGKSMADNISDPNGNYGNMFSIWDQLFKTATFTRQYPTELGLLNDPKEEWTASYLWPLVKSKNTESEIGKGYVKEKTTIMKPVIMELEAGTYLWCQCGYSKNQPFCDGSHHGTKIKPLKFQVDQKRKLKLCNCKLTEKGPFCDGNHKMEDQAKG